MTEIWKPVVGYEGIYEVSSLGHVRSLARVIYRNLTGPTPIKARVLRNIPTRNGYLSVCLSKDKCHWPWNIHVLVLCAFVGPRPEGSVTRHLNGNRADNRLENLMWGTAQENTNDRERHGTMLRGKDHPMAKLTENEVTEIKQLRGYLSLKQIGQMFGVHFSTIHLIHKEKSWQGVRGCPR